MRSTTVWDDVTRSVFLSEFTCGTEPGWRSLKDQSMTEAEKPQTLQVSRSHDVEGTGPVVNILCCRGQKSNNVCSCKFITSLTVGPVTYIRVNEN